MEYKNIEKVKKAAIELFDNVTDEKNSPKFIGKTIGTIIGTAVKAYSDNKAMKGQNESEDNKDMKYIQYLDNFIETITGCKAETYVKAAIEGLIKKLYD